MFQQTISNVQPYGVPGNRYDNGPWRATSYILNSVSAAYNIVGATAFTQTTEGNAAAGNSTGVGVYVGILVNGNNLPLNGTTLGALQPSLQIGNGYNAQFVTEGAIWVTLPAAAVIGDVVIYDNTTGALSTIVPGTGLPAGKSYANANVFKYNVSAAGTALILLAPNAPR